MDGHIIRNDEGGLTVKDGHTPPIPLGYWALAPCHPCRGAQTTPRRKEQGARHTCGVGSGCACQRPLRAPF